MNFSLHQLMKNCLYITCSFLRVCQKYVSLKAINFYKIVAELVLYAHALTNLLEAIFLSVAFCKNIRTFFFISGIVCSVRRKLKFKFK